VESEGEDLAETNLTVLVTPAQDLPGQWVAHCLNIDIVTQGDSIQHALAMAREAVLMVVRDDLIRGRDPLQRRPAPEECWEPLIALHRHGRPLSSFKDQSHVQVAAGMLKLHVPIDALPPHARPSEPEVEMLPAWQIAALESLRSGPVQHC
jgi:hypothetical protein